MDAAVSTLSDFEVDEAPRWQEPVVLISLAAIAAAAGFGVLYEAGAAPWLSTTTALVTATVLFSVHRGLRPRMADVAPEALGIGRAASPAPVPPQGPRAAPLPTPTAWPTQACATPSASLTAQPSQPPSRAAMQEADLAQFVPRQQPTLAPRAPLLPFTQSRERRAEADVNFEQLETLIRHMAAGVPGPKATSPDPDLPRSQARATPVLADPYGRPPALPIGFGAPAVGRDGQRVAAALAAERIDVLLTPIHSLTEQRASHFEVSVQLRDEDGSILADDEVARVVRHGGLAGKLDALKLSRVARVARRVQARGGAPADVLTDVFGPSLADSTFIAASSTACAGPTPAPMVLALSQADVRGFGRVHWSALATLGDLGLRFAISDVTDLDMDFELMAARGFVFAKLDAAVFLGGLPLGTVVIPATDVVRHLSGCGLTLIVDRIDDEARLDEIASHGVSFGQGALFGMPKPVRQDILAELPRPS